ncbi:putative bifunctional diguanylate cyclase/phosphodiesterase [Undibacterium luofuense]|uniref:EAL domain-containing protein n=1 Tax=Undibacterium luofuense TaxID=2828733 RepID=A0A941DKM1_9BURK|nr:EAL domain-containing protein [Undibacterium luofuense]MBR7782563.1 EAL domain-containing protein [Undibacterium luofuense]
MEPNQPQGSDIREHPVCVWVAQLGQFLQLNAEETDRQTVASHLLQLIVAMPGVQEARICWQDATGAGEIGSVSAGDGDTPPLTVRYKGDDGFSLLLHLRAHPLMHATLECWLQGMLPVAAGLMAGAKADEDAALFAALTAQSPFSVLILNAAGELIYANQAYAISSGYCPDDQRGQPVLWRSGDGFDNRLRGQLLALKEGECWEGEILTRRADGRHVWEQQTVSVLTRQGVVTHLIAIRRTLSHAQRQLREVEQALLLREQALVSSSNGIMITRSDASDHSIVYVNPAFEKITGYSADEVIGREGRFLVRDDLQQPDLEEIRTALREKRAGTALLRNYRKDGTQFWNELHISPVKDAQGAVTTHFVSVINDVSERVRYQKELEYQATHDSLTGLANRSLLNDRIAQAIAWAKRSGLFAGVLLLDLDHFKLINDASGHGAGDEMLRQVAARLTQCVRDTDTVARLGGDEFVVVLTDLADTADIDVVAEKILQTLARPIDIQGQEIFVTASIGTSVYPRDGDHGEILLRYADIAMYRVKEHGRNSVRQFIPEMGQNAISRLNMEAAMRRGLEQNEFLLHFQPKIDLTSRKVVGAEALIRWQHPQIGLIHPVEFIGIAEESGLIIQLGEWVLRRACEQQVRWREAGLASLQIAVNMSSRQFRQDDLASKVAQIILDTGIDPARLTLELTESMVMQDLNSTLATLRSLKNLGVSISLDDFGTGYSSLSYLRRFPIDELKIDKSFINDIHTNPDDAAIASAVIAMSLSLGLDVVAEGIENAEQAAQLREMKCHQGQGYYFSRPVDAEQFAAFVRRQEG